MVCCESSVCSQTVVVVVETIADEHTSEQTGDARRSRQGAGGCKDDPELITVHSILSDTLKTPKSLKNTCSARRIGGRGTGSRSRSQTVVVVVAEPMVDEHDSKQMGDAWRSRQEETRMILQHPAT
ncbi:hypothetical protein B9Z55_009994 [Caenorhabditis nigoni]|uniref:Uncharacterized protein n=1 Tax=Caenorhabditis nigoni TaxID=1611254 RepID=A0A2G5UUC5_9PELO|nr:hypothetical protein B9Z55_009994 [Caenorhabditis nigoni]